MRLIQCQADALKAKGAKKEFDKARGLLENARKGAIVVAMLTSGTLALSCGDEPGPTPDGGHTDGGTVTDSGTHDGGDGGDGGSGSLCTLYGEGHENRITLALGQEVRSGESACSTKLVFKGISGDAANFGMYAPPDTYPVGYWSLGVGEQRRVFFKDSGWTYVEPCAMTANDCDINLPVGTTSGDTNCTVTVAADRRWIP